jgi:hypothetical protein
MESNHLMPPYQDGAHPESFAGMDPSGRLELPCQHYRSCGSPSILAGNGSGDGSRTHPAALRVPNAAVNISPEKNKPWSPALKSNQLIRFTRPVHRRQCLQGLSISAMHLCLHDISGAGYGTRTRVRRLATFDSSRQLGLNQ